MELANHNKCLVSWREKNDKFAERLRQANFQKSQLNILSKENLSHIKPHLKVPTT